jgi:hypothetical protein
VEGDCNRDEATLGKYISIKELSFMPSEHLIANAQLVSETHTLHIDNPLTQN